jgi:hypothetical protein
MRPSTIRPRACFRWCVNKDVDTVHAQLFVNHLSDQIPLAASLARADPRHVNRSTGPRGLLADSRKPIAQS